MFFYIHSYLIRANQILFYLLRLYKKDLLMATGCQNINANSTNSSQISSINTYKLTKQYYPRSPPPTNLLKTGNTNLDSSSPSPNSVNDSSSQTTNTNEPQKIINNESTYADLNQQQCNEYTHAQNLKIKTKSIESTLLPLVNQVSFYTGCFFFIFV